MAQGGCLHRRREPLLVERPAPGAVDVEAHRVAATGIGQHQLVEGVETDAWLHREAAPGDGASGPGATALWARRLYLRFQASAGSRGVKNGLFWPRTGPRASLRIS